MVLDVGGAGEGEEDPAALEEVEVNDSGLVDEGKATHDNAVAKTIRGLAIQIMADRGVEIDGDEEKMALQLFPQVCSFLLISNTILMTF